MSDPRLQHALDNPPGPRHAYDPQARAVDSTGIRTPHGAQHLPASPLPSDALARKNLPLMRGALDYFPAALAEVSNVSRVGNEQHNPGQPMHHARGKSSDHADCAIRHLMDRGKVDELDGLRHTAKAAWRVLALLQEELEQAGAPLARGARLPELAGVDLGASEPGKIGACVADSKGGAYAQPGTYEVSADGTCTYTPSAMFEKLPIERELDALKARTVRHG